MLSVSGLVKSYGDVRALRGVDLTVERGQIVSVLGPNGAGKSTLLSIVAGLVRPDEGSVQVDGVSGSDRQSIARRIGYAPQATGIYPVLTVRQNLEFFGELAGARRDSRAARAEAVAEQLGLTELLDRRAGRLSGGEARRLHTACALVHSPPLLMLDEPTVGADIATRAQLIAAVKELADAGAAVVYTTHYLAEVEALDSDIVVINRGRVLASGTLAQLVEDHREVGLTFEVDGPIPERLRSRVESIGPRRYKIAGDVGMSYLLDEFGADADHLVSVQTLQPDLETVFLAMTGTASDTSGGES